jgi:hypothetical protein
MIIPQWLNATEVREFERYMNQQDCISSIEETALDWLEEVYPQKDESDVEDRVELARDLAEKFGE